MSIKKELYQELYKVGIDVGGSTIKAGVVDGKGQIVGDVETIPTQLIKDGEGFVKAIAGLANKLAMQNGVSIQSIGVGLPGLIKDGVWVNSPNIPNCNNVNVVRELGRLTDAFIYIANDAKTAAIAEFEAMKDKKDFIYVTIGTGIGFAKVENGKAVNFEGGHQTIDKTETALMCGCGKKGHLEAYASSKALENIARQTYGTLHTIVAGNQGLFNEFKEYLRSMYGWMQSSKTIYEAARNGNGTASGLISEQMDNLAEGLATVADITGISNFVIGGAMAKSFDVFGKMLEKNINDKVFKGTKCEVGQAQVEHNGVIGASLLWKYGEKVKVRSVNKIGKNLKK